MYRSTAVANNIGSLGYLAAMIAALSFAMLPRSKFIQLLLRNMLFACLGCPFAILGLWAARQARNHTQPPGDHGQYNSSAAAVSAIFLFVNVFIGNAFRAVRPLSLYSGPHVCAGLIE
jgi:Putative ER transporter, 6TM, N-terminal